MPARAVKNLLAIWCTAVVTVAACLAAESTTKPAVEFSQFGLLDQQGQPRKLAEFVSSRGVVVVFLGTECPLARTYLPRLIDYRRTFADQGFGLVTVDANAQDAPTEIADLVREFSLPFAVL